MKFLKGLGLGVIYIVISPLIIVGIVLMMVYGVIRWLVTMVIGIIRFFKGDKFFKPLQEDIDTENAIKAQQEKILAKEAAEAQPQIQPAPQQTTTYVQNNYYTNPNQQATPNLGQINPQIDAQSYQELPENPSYQEIDFKPAEEEPVPELTTEKPFEFPEEGGDL